MTSLLPRLMSAVFLASVLLAFVLAVLRIFGRPGPAWLTRAVYWGAVPVLALRVVQTHLWPADVALGDFRAFWLGGRDLLAGRNPFAVDHGLPFLYPPPTFPVFAALGRLPFTTAALAWQAVGVLMAAGLVGLSRRTYDALAEGPEGRLAAGETAELAAAVTLSTTVAVCLSNGQLGIFIAFMGYLAVLLEARGRPALAGLALLGVAFKPQTLLPFLILFLKRRAVPAWVTLAAGTLVSMLLFFPPPRWPELATTWLAQVRAASLPGAVNDYSSANVHNGSILSFAVVLDGLGLRDRTAIALATTGLVGLMGLAIALEVAVLRRLPPAAHVSLVACYALLFMYHRGNHDCAVLAFPLVHAYALTRGGGRPAWWARLAACALLVTMHMTASSQMYLARASWSLGALGWLVRVVVIPRSVYLLALACLFFWLAPRLPRSGAAAGAGAAAAADAV